jgi:integrase
MAVFRRGNIYHYEFWFQEKRYRGSTGLTNERAAQRVEDLKLDSLKRVAVGLPDPLAELQAPVTLGEYIPTFLAWSGKVHRKATTALHRANCGTLERYFGDRRLDLITRGDVTDFMVARSHEQRTNVVGEIAPTGERVQAPDPSSARSLFLREVKRYERATVGRAREIRTVKGTVSNVSVNRAVTTLRLLYGLAQGKYPHLLNPARGGRGGIRLLPETEVQRILQDDEFKRYLTFTSRDLGHVAQIMRELGPRPQDVCSLTIKQCNFKDETLQFWPKPKPRSQVVAVALADRGKSKNSARSVAMSPTVRRILEERVAEARELGSEFLFPARDRRSKTLIPGRSRTPNSLNKPHNRAIRRAGITDRVRLYDLRHTFAASAVNNGMHPRTLQDMLGHSDPKMTMRYTVKNDLTAQRAYFARLEKV